MSRTQVFVIVSGIALLTFVLELVRRRRLREQYSWLWLLTATGYLLVAVWPELARWVGELIGSPRLISTFTFLGFFFLFLIAIQFSVQISRLTEQNKDLAQQIAILDCGLRELMDGREQRDEETAQGELESELLPDPSETAPGTVPALGAESNML